MLIFALDADACDGTNIRAAQAADYAMIKLNHEDFKSKLQDSSTDSGGGGVHVGLLSQIQVLDQVNPNAKCHSCVIHSLCLMFINSITKFCGTSGAKNLNSL